MQHWRDWLIAQRGRPMERAIIRAEQRYNKQKPARIRLSKIRSAYRERR